MIKHIALLTLSACALCACGGNYLTKTDNALKNQDALTMCTELAASNRTDLERIHTKYGLKTATLVQPLFNELDTKTNNICRSRMARQMQNEQIDALRAAYNVKITDAIRNTQK